MTGKLQASKPICARESGSRANRDGAHVWITGALDLLAIDGPEALRIERLARHIGVSKGSFYWFFDGREDLLSSVLDHWRRDYNDAVFAEVEAVASDRPLADKLAHLIAHVRGSDLGRYDAAIRAWALRDDRARSVIDAVDRDRLAFLVRLFGDPEPAMRAHLFYRAFIAEAQVATVPAGQAPAQYLYDVAEYLAALPAAPEPEREASPDETPSHSPLSPECIE